MLFSPVGFRPFYPVEAPVGVYTWATKPPAAGNAGKKIIVSDMRNSEWWSNGAYWAPVGGVLSITVDCAGVSSSNPALGTVTVPNMPLLPLKEWLSTPGAVITTWSKLYRMAPASTQAVNVHLRPLGSTINLFYALYANTNNNVYVTGNVANVNPTQLIYSPNLEPSSGALLTDVIGDVSALPNGLSVPQLSMRAGATDGSETVYLQALNFTLRM